VWRLPHRGTAMAFGLIKLGPKLQSKVDGGGPASNTCLRDGSNAGRPARPESPSLDNKPHAIGTSRTLGAPPKPYGGKKQDHNQRKCPGTRGADFGARALGRVLAGTTSVWQDTLKRCVEKPRGVLLAYPLGQITQDAG
jgi:hypothetical protein